MENKILDMGFLPFFPLLSSSQSYHLKNSCLAETFLSQKKAQFSASKIMLFIGNSWPNYLSI